MADNEQGILICRACGNPCKKVSIPPCDRDPETDEMRDFYRGRCGSDDYRIIYGPICGKRRCIREYKAVEKKISGPSTDEQQKEPATSQHKAKKKRRGAIEIPGYRKLEEEWMRITLMSMSAIERGDKEAFKTAYSDLGRFVADLRSTGRMAFLDGRQPLGKRDSPHSPGSPEITPQEMKIRTMHLAIHNRLAQLGQKITRKFQAELCVNGQGERETSFAIERTVRAMIVDRLLRDSKSAEKHAHLGKSNPLRGWFPTTD